MKAISPWRLLIYGAFVSIAGAYAANAFRSEHQLAVGTPVPQVKLPVHGADEIDLGEAQEQVLVITFWASWCGSCREEIPTLNRIQQQGKARVVGISVDDADELATQKLAEGVGVAFPIVGGRQDLADTFLVDVLPTVYVVARDGTITFAHRGFVEEATLQEAVEAASSRRI